MSLVTKIVTIMGVVGTILGLFWVFTGFLDYASGAKNRDRNRQDEGLNSIIWGGVIAAVSAGIATAIIAALGGITF